MSMKIVILYEMHIVGSDIECGIFSSDNITKFTKLYGRTIWVFWHMQI